MKTIKFRAWGVGGSEDEEVTKMRYSDEYCDLQAFFCLCYGQAGQPVKGALMQFTGFLDKNGKEIYEGDIVKIPFHDGIQEYNAEIKWSGTGWTINDHGSNKDVEIIGNIHENPELLGTNN